MHSEELPVPEMTGTIVKWMDEGYGFIQPDEGKDVFFHKSDTDFDPSPGKRVVFLKTLNLYNGKPRALRVRTI